MTMPQRTFKRFSFVLFLSALAPVHQAQAEDIQLDHYLYAGECELASSSSSATALVEVCRDGDGSGNYNVGFWENDHYAFTPASGTSVPSDAVTSDEKAQDNGVEEDDDAAPDESQQVQPGDNGSGNANGALMSVPRRAPQVCHRHAFHRRICR